MPEHAEVARALPSMLLGCIAATLIAACGGEPSPPPGRAIAAPRPSPHGEGRVPRAVPRADLAGADAPARGGRGRGVLLGSHWFGADGSVVDTSPQAAVRWSLPLAVGGGPIRLRVRTRRLATRVQLTSFDKPLGRSGVPRGPGETQTCGAGTPRDGVCGYARAGDEIEVTLSARRRAPAVVVLVCEWFVPPSERPLASRTNPVVTASWGFRLRGDPPRRAA